LNQVSEADMPLSRDGLNSDAYLYPVATADSLIRHVNFPAGHVGATRHRNVISHLHEIPFELLLDLFHISFELSVLKLEHHNP
jgi:hypothetical protein